MADTMTVRFTRTYVVKDEEARTFEAGETYELNTASAMHFVRRRIAEPVKEADKRAVREMLASGPPTPLATETASTGAVETSGAESPSKRSKR